MISASSLSGIKVKTFGERVLLLVPDALRNIRNNNALDKVERFVKINKHLPQIPSASEVEKDGIDLQNMDARLLQKVEELTLYVIQQQKKINDLEKRLNKAEKK